MGLAEEIAAWTSAPDAVRIPNRTDPSGVGCEAIQAVSVAPSPSTSSVGADITSVGASPVGGQPGAVAGREVAGSEVAGREVAGREVVVGVDDAGAATVGSSSPPAEQAASTATAVSRTGRCRVRMLSTERRAVADCNRSGQPRR
jgi:hypothetical protein